MHFTNLDACYYLASIGNKEAYNLLYECFVFKAKMEVAINGYDLRKNSEFSANFDDLVNELFFKTINSYSEEKGSFSNYCTYCFRTRLVNEIAKVWSELNQEYSDADLNDSECALTANEIMDPDYPSIRHDIEIANFRYRISSCNRNATPKKRIVNKVVLMIYAGFKAGEIMKTLKLSKSQYRSIMQRIKKDDDIANLKLEMK